MAETPGGNQTPGKASKKLKDSKFGETIVEEVRSRYTAALSHLPDPALSERARGPGEAAGESAVRWAAGGWRRGCAWGRWRGWQAQARVGVGRGAEPGAARGLAAVDRSQSVAADRSSPSQRTAVSPHRRKWPCKQEFQPSGRLKP